MIDEQSNDRLREQYNPEGSELRTLQEHLLILLRRIDSVCKEHGIEYWLSSGTCLGAVRHGGFIPWDDDIDVEMTREGYERFVKVWQDDEDFVLQTWQNDLYYTEPFAKLRLRNTYVYEGRLTPLYKYQGLFLDIFIMERSNAAVAHFCHFILGSLRHLSYHVKKGAVTDFAFKVLKRMCFAIVDGMRLFRFLADSREMRHTIGTGVVKNLRKRDEVFPLSEMMFEGSLSPVPGDVDAYLKRMFGDYMKVPSKIHTHSLKGVKYAK